jgi:hypothetical protein
VLRRFMRQIIEMEFSTRLRMPSRRFPPPWTNYLLLNFDCASGGRPAVLAAAPILSAAVPLPRSMAPSPKTPSRSLLRLRRATLIHPHPRG